MNDLILKRIGERIRVIRQEHGLTQERLAERVNLHPTYISEIENGKANVSLQALASLARSLGVSLGDLVPSHKKTLPLELEADLTKALLRLSTQSRRNQEIFLRILRLLIDLPQ